jgi:hypothetical protein
MSGELFISEVDENRSLVMKTDGWWWCHDIGLPVRKWRIATIEERKLIEEITRLRDALRAVVGEE